jgi:hypothetical protein
MRWRGLLIAEVVVVLAAACSNGSASPASKAERACKKAARAEYYNSQATTVDAVDSVTWGRDRSGHPFAGLLKGKGFAAWCWEWSDGPYVSYLVGPHGERVEVAQQNDLKPAPGPPMPFTTST